MMKKSFLSEDSLSEIADEMIEISAKEYLGKATAIDERRYKELCEVVNKKLYIKGIDSRFVEARFLKNILAQYQFIEATYKERVSLSSLFVIDDDKIINLPNSQRVKALKGEILYSNTKRRNSNFPEQSNEMRLMEAVEFIRKNGYPFEESYIFIEERRKFILDGWHRAAALFYLFGDIQIEVIVIKYNEETKDPFAQCFPVGLLGDYKRISVYGAGAVGKKYIEYIMKDSDYELVHWYDKKFNSIQNENGIAIENPEEISDDKNKECFIIANTDWKQRAIIKEYLINKGIDEKNVVF